MYRVQSSYYVICKPRNLKPRNLILRVSSSFSRKFPPTKITRYTVGSTLCLDPNGPIGTQRWAVSSLPSASHHPRPTLFPSVITCRGEQEHWINLVEFCRNIWLVNKRLHLYVTHLVVREHLHCFDFIHCWLDTLCHDLVTNVFHCRQQKCTFVLLEV